MQLRTLQSRCVERKLRSYVNCAMNWGRGASVLGDLYVFTWICRRKIILFTQFFCKSSCWNKRILNYARSLSMYACFSIRSFPCLWLVASKEYSYRARKKQTYEILIEKYKVIDPEANRETITKKNNSCREYRSLARRLDSTDTTRFSWC